MDAKIVTLGGDGIGPGIVAETRRVLEAVGDAFGHRFFFEEQLLGGAAIDATGTAMPPETLVACESADAVLLGAVGGPKWDDPTATVRPEQGLLGLRKALGLFANLRPVRVYPELVSASPLRPERLDGVDLVVVRELTGGLYFGRPQLRETLPGGAGVRAVDTLEYTDAEIERVVRLACNIARGRRNRVTSVDKANVLESSRLWRQVATRVAAEFSDIEIEHQLVDSAAMRLISQPRAFDVMVTENMFGDILTDEAAVISGSLGLLPSASVGVGRCGLYEPIHGSAPDIAGKGIANPLGTVLSAALLLRYSLSLEKEAALVERAVERALAAGIRTPDLGGTASTREAGESVVQQLRALAISADHFSGRTGAVTQASSSLQRTLRLGLPKGRMQHEVLALLAEAGIRIDIESRGYRPRVSLEEFEAKILKPQNIVEMLHVGSRDVGFAGADWVEELGVELVELLDTGLDPVKIVAAAPQGSLEEGKLPTGRTLVVASEYERLTTRWIAEQGLQATFVRSYGATEVFPPEDADCIVDNSATGSTLRDNGLEVVDTLTTSSTRLYTHRRVLDDAARAEAVQRFTLLLQSVLDARRRVMLEVNISGDRMDALVSVLPCMRQPTIASLHGGQGFAVKAAVPRNVLPTLIPKIRELGGTDLVITKLAQIIP